MAVASDRPVAVSARSARAQTAVLHVAWELFLERGLRGVTVEAVAERSSVAKTTIYRHWPSKNALILDALHQHLDSTITFPDTGSVRTDLTRQIRSVIRLLATAAGGAYLALVAESQHDPELATALRERYITQRRAGATETIIRGVNRGELPADTDPGLLIDTLYGAVYYRLLVSHDRTPPTYADRLVLAVLGPAEQTH